MAYCAFDAALTLLLVVLGLIKLDHLRPDSSVVGGARPPQPIEFYQIEVFALILDDIKK